ncbi:MAG: cytidylate kinase, partial [Acidobacteria bacterium]|nr:cytidylate kinase [Acidobacteriota bacterium]
MPTKGSAESSSTMHLVERQMLLRRVQEVGAPHPAALEPTAGYRFITITRNVGALGDAIASELSQHLQWHVFDKEIVNFIAQDNRVREDLVRELDERARSLIHDTVERFLLMVSGISFGSEEYRHALIRTLAYIAARGKAIIIGRGSAFALQGEPGFHVRVVASPDVRVGRLAERWRVTAEEARIRMQQIDAERRSFIHQHFKHDLEELKYYHAVFNTDRLTPGQVAAAVMGMLTRR